MITYELILEHLAPLINTFSNKQNIMMKSSDFTYFKDIFDDTFYRYGIRINDSDIAKSINISLYNSLLYCLNIDSLDLPDNNLWTLANTIHINIIVFDFKNNTISATHFGDFFNPWRPTIYLANYEQFWEPIVSNETKLFSLSSYKTLILKNKILPSNIKKYNESENITINDNFMEILELEQLVNNKFDSNQPIHKNLTEDVFVNLANEHSSPCTFSKNKLDKMKKEELLQIISNMNILIEKARPTKKDLIELICKE
jgi:hypothetical protein